MRIKLNHVAARQLAVNSTRDCPEHSRKQKQPSTEAILIRRGEGDSWTSERICTQPLRRHPAR